MRTQHAPLPMPAPTPPSSSLVSPQRPAMAYAGIARPTAATVQLERQASIHRTLPQHQGTSSSTGRKKPRLAGNPRPYSTPVATLNDFTSPSSEVPTTVPLTIGILPKVVRLLF